MGKDKRILLAVTEEDLNRYKRSAHQNYATLSEYIRNCVEQNIKCEVNSMVQIDKELLKQTVNIVVNYIEDIEEEAIFTLKKLLKTEEDEIEREELINAIASEEEKAKEARELLIKLHSSLVGRASEGQKNYPYIKGYTAEEHLKKFVLNNN